MPELNGVNPGHLLSDDDLRFIHESFDLAERDEGEWVGLIVDEEGVRVEPSNEGEAQRLPVDGGVPIVLTLSTSPISSESGEAAQRP